MNEPVSGCWFFLCVFVYRLGARYLNADRVLLLLLLLETSFFFLGDGFNLSRLLDFPSSILETCFVLLCLVTEFI